MSVPLERERAAKFPRGEGVKRVATSIVSEKGSLRRTAERRVELHEVAPNAHRKHPRTLCS